MSDSGFFELACYIVLSSPLIPVYPHLIHHSCPHMLSEAERENEGQLQVSSALLSGVGIFLLIKSQSEALSGCFQWHKHTA